MIQLSQLRAESVNVRQLAILAISVVIAGGSFVLMRKQGAVPAAPQPVAAPKKEEIKTLKVLVTNREYAVGDRIVPSTLVWQDWPANANLQSFITEKINPKAAETYVDAVVTIPMVAGEPVVASKLVAANDKSGVMAALLTPGMRATSVNITPDTSVAGFILPNNRVDILLTRQIQFQINGQPVNRTVTSTIFENVRILAVDQLTTTAKDQKSFPGQTATVELSPADSEKLKAADALGDISLVLRSYADTQGPTISHPDALALAQPKPTAVKQNMQAQVQPNGQPLQQGPQNTASNVKIYRGGQ